MILKKIVEETNEKLKRKLYILSGPPAIGKSTWIKKTFGNERPYIISRDDIVDEVASQMGLSYDEMFKAPPKDATIGDIDPAYGKVVKSPAYMSWQPLSYEIILKANGEIQKRFQNRVSQAHNSNQSIVVDMTNMNAKSRQSAMKAIEGHEDQYDKIAVVFNFRGGEQVIKDMAKKRAELARQAGKPKTIPDHVMDDMMKKFQDIQDHEGFDSVQRVDTIPDLIKNL
jgi:predicted kinase